MVPEKVALAECDDERLLLSVLEAQEVAVLSADALSETLCVVDGEKVEVAEAELDTLVLPLSRMLEDPLTLPDTDAVTVQLSVAVEDTEGQGDAVWVPAALGDAVSQAVRLEDTEVEGEETALTEEPADALEEPDKEGDAVADAEFWMLPEGDCDSMTERDALAQGVAAQLADAEPDGESAIDGVPDTLGLPVAPCDGVSEAEAVPV